MNKIATHDSAKGEKGRDFLSFLVTPFCQVCVTYIQCRQGHVSGFSVGK